MANYKPASNRVEVLGKRFGRLLVVGEVEKEFRKSRFVREVVCQCDCGEIVIVRLPNLLSGNTQSCGCLDLELRRKKALDSVIGKKFGRLLAIQEAEDSTNRKIRILCLCDCGIYKSVSIKDLRQGKIQSCGCLKKEKAKEKYTEDLTGQTFYELTAIKQVENYVGSTGLERVQWLWRCSCDREIIAMPMNVKRGMIKSCGHIGKSYAETKIFEFLVDHNILFDHNICPFDDLVNPETNHKLYCDFVIYLPNGNPLIIEHQGEQHFYTESRKNDFGKLQREITDNVKRKYFKKNNILFYETRYDEDYIQKIETILSENGFLLSA